MGGYIGAKTGTLVASASDIRGDISATDATPEITLKNTTETDADGTRSGKITFKGEQSGGEESVLAQIQGSHDGTADDEKGDLIFKTNDGNDALAPTERLRINSAGDVLVSSPDPSLTITNTTEEDSDGGRESTIVFKGEQSGGELSTLAEIEASHDGTADDEKADLIFRTNDGSDGTSPTTAMIIDSAQNVGINATPKETHADADVIRFGGTGYIANWEDAEVYLSENMYQDTSGAYKYLTASHASLYSQTTGMHQFKTAGSGSADAAITFTERMRIGSDGMVGIGNTVASDMVGTSSLTIGTGASGEAAVYTVYSNSDTYGGVYFADGTSGTDRYAGGIDYNHGNDTLSLSTQATGRLTIDGAGRFRVPSAYSSTTSSGANAVVQSDGKFERSTSSLRYKNTVNDATHGLTELLTLRPVTFKGNNDGDTVFGGLIAEEVHDAGLTEFVQYDDENRPDALSYGNMVSLCIKAIQEQQSTITAQATKIETLEKENTAIKARLDALEAG